MTTRSGMTSKVMFHQAIAERLGLNATDFKCLGLLNRHGPITAGRLAELTGLTTGAITGVVNRLEQAGFVRRERDPDDRRRVIIRTIEDRFPNDQVGPIFALLSREMAAELDGRYSQEQWAAITDFVRRITAVLRRVTEATR